MGESVSFSDLYADARFTEEISTRMQVPDRIVVSAGPSSPTKTSAAFGGGFGGFGGGRHNNFVHSGEHHDRLDMRVPDRITMGGASGDVFSSSSPKKSEPASTRVATPPRSIRLDRHSFPCATDDELSSSSPSSSPTFGGGDDDTTAEVSEEIHFKSLSPQKQPRSSLSPADEMRLLRREMAKLNHRLMAVELENRQKQQREMLLTVIVSAYFLAKVVGWINRTM